MSPGVAGVLVLILWWGAQVWMPKPRDYIFQSFLGQENFISPWASRGTFVLWGNGGGGVLWGNRWWMLWALGAHLTFGLEALGIDAFPFTHSRRQNWTSKPWESRADALNSGSSKLHKIRNTGPGQLDNLPETQPWPMAKPDNSRALIGNSSFHQTAFL